jgi:hypothetical protein
VEALSRILCWLVRSLDPGSDTKITYALISRNSDGIPGRTPGGARGQIRTRHQRATSESQSHKAHGSDLQEGLNEVKIMCRFSSAIWEVTGAAGKPVKAG